MWGTFKFPGMAWASSLLKETGASMYKFGGKLEGRYYDEAQLSAHRRLVPFGEQKPVVGQGAWIAPNASVIGKVDLGSHSSVWYGSVLRGDVQRIKIGSKTNIQDRCVVHVRSGDDNHGTYVPLSTLIGNHVTVEAGVILHACVLEDGCKVEAGAKILDGASIGSHSVVASGALVTAGTSIPSREYWAGAPARFVRKVSDEEVEKLRQGAEDIYKLAVRHDIEQSKTQKELFEEKILEKYYEPDHAPRPFKGTPEIKPRE